MVLVPVGHLLPDAESLNTTKGAPDNKVPSQDWDALVDRARSQIIETMEKRLGITDLRSKITWEGTNTPLTCELKSRSQAVSQVDVQGKTSST